VATEVVVPMLGITVEKGTIVEWLKSEGDLVEKGEIIFIVETEKVTTEVESPASGILAKIIVPVGVEVPVLTLAAVITEPGEELPAEYATQAIRVHQVRQKLRPRVSRCLSPRLLRRPRLHLLDPLRQCLLLESWPKIRVLT